MATQSNRKSKLPDGWAEGESWPELKHGSRVIEKEKAGGDPESYSSLLNGIQIEVEIRQSGKPGAIKAYADMRLLFPDGELRIMGFGIIKQSGKAPWVGFPENHGQNRYFPVVIAKGRVRDAIVKAILQQYEKSNAS